MTQQEKRERRAEQQVKKAVKAMDAAITALEPFALDDPNDSVMRLRSDLREYADYLEKATWWRNAAALSRSRQS